MKLIQPSRLSEFCSLVFPFLLEDEATDHLLLGSCGELQRASGSGQVKPQLLVIVDETARSQTSSVQGCVLNIPGQALLLSRQRSSESIATIAAGLRALGSKPVGVIGRSEDIEIFTAQWKLSSGASASLLSRQVIYSLKAAGLHAPTQTTGQLRVATPDRDLSLVAHWLLESEREEGGSLEPALARRQAEHKLAAGEVVLLDLLQPDKTLQPVSMSMASGPTPGGIRINSVFTPSPLRGQGYATACLHQHCRRLFAQGVRHCFLSVDRTNAAAHKLYAKLGFEPAGNSEHRAFRY